MVEVVLGKRYKDRISGFEGTATSMTEYLNGTVQYGLEPLVDKDGKMQDAINIDAGQLVEVETKEAVKPARTGGPNSKVVRANG